MRKILSYILTLCLVTLTVSSCSSSEEMSLPAIYLPNTNYVVAQGDVEIKLLAEKAPSQEIEIPIKFAGEAVIGTDFTTSALSFKLKPGETEATITISRIATADNDKSKNLIINLRSQPAGYEFNLLNYAVVELMGKQGAFITFDSFRDIMKYAKTFIVSLKNMKGYDYITSQDISFKYEVDPASTAVEDIHYKFTTTREKLEFKKGGSQASIGIQFLKKEEGKNKLILKLNPQPGFALGTNSKLELTINGPSQLEGKWQFDKFTNLDELKYGWGDVSDMNKIPMPSTSDYLEFVGNDFHTYTFKPSFTSSYKDYFGSSERTITFDGELERSYSPSEEEFFTSTLSKYITPDINVAFSATNKEVRNANLYYQIIEVNGEEMLECTLEDFKSTDFLVEVAEITQGDMQWTPLRLRFKRVK